MIDRKHGWLVSFKPLYLGVTLGAILTFAAYRIASRYHLSVEVMTEVLLGIAFLQAILHMVFFLQVGLESKPRWNTITTIYTFLVILLIVLGSLWIMRNLNYDLMG